MGRPEIWLISQLVQLFDQLWEIALTRPAVVLGLAAVGALAASFFVPVPERPARRRAIAANRRVSRY